MAFWLVEQLLFHFCALVKTRWHKASSLFHTIVIMICIILDRGFRKVIDFSTNWQKLFEGIKTYQNTESIQINAIQILSHETCLELTQKRNLPHCAIIFLNTLFKRQENSTNIFANQKVLNVSYFIFTIMSLPRLRVT